MKLGFESSGMSGRAKEVFNMSERSGKGGGMTLEATNIFSHLPCAKCNSVIFCIPSVWGIQKGKSLEGS